MTDEEILKLWREMPSEYKQFDELVLEFARKLTGAQQAENELLKQVEENLTNLHNIALESREAILSAAHSAIDYVGSANYDHRIREAHQMVRKAAEEG